MAWFYIRVENEEGAKAVFAEGDSVDDAANNINSSEFLSSYDWIEDRTKFIFFGDEERVRTHVGSLAPPDVMFNENREKITREDLNNG